MNNDIEMILNYFLDDTFKLIEQINFQEEPESSPIICSKRLELFISVKKQLDKTFVINNIGELIFENGYDEDFYKEFLEKISEEKPFFNE